MKKLVKITIIIAVLSALIGLFAIHLAVKYIGIISSRYGIIERIFDDKK